MPKKAKAIFDTTENGEHDIYIPPMVVAEISSSNHTNSPISSGTWVSPQLPRSRVVERVVLFSAMRCWARADMVGIRMGGILKGWEGFGSFGSWGYNNFYYPGNLKNPGAGFSPAGEYDLGTPHQ